MSRLKIKRPNKRGSKVKVKLNQVLKTFKGLPCVFQEGADLKNLTLKEACLNGLAYAEKDVTPKEQMKRYSLGAKIGATDDEPETEIELTAADITLLVSSIYKAHPSPIIGPQAEQMLDPPIEKEGAKNGN